MHLYADKLNNSCSTYKFHYTMYATLVIHKSVAHTLTGHNILQIQLLKLSQLCNTIHAYLTQSVAIHVTYNYSMLVTSSQFAKYSLLTWSPRLVCVCVYIYTCMRIYVCIYACTCMCVCNIYVYGLSLSTRLESIPYVWLTSHLLKPLHVCFWH